MTPQVLHVFPDSPFLSFVVDIFETVAPGANTFLVYGNRGEFGQHVTGGADRVESIAADKAGLRRVAHAAATSDVVISHSMGQLGVHALRSAPRRALRVWSGWGGDYYGSDFSGLAQQLGPTTARYYRSHRSAKDRVLGPASRFVGSRRLHAAARMSDIFSAPIPDDLSVFSRRFRGFRGSYSQLNYASVEDNFSLASVDADGNDILVGNSASLANNHFEVLELLAAVGVHDRRVVVPLSYGDRRYADAVVDLGAELFGSSFVPLREFMPIDEYQRIVSRCSTVVMGHQRQQGIGNVASALWGGAHVLLDERNPLARFLSARQGSFGTLADLASAGLPSGRLSSAELTANRRLLQDFWGRSTVLKNAETLIGLAGQR